LKYDINYNCRLTIITLDSLGYSHNSTGRQLKAYLMLEGKKWSHSFEDIITVPGKGIPQQKNFDDCGVCTLGYIGVILQDPDRVVKGLLQGKFDSETCLSDAGQLRNVIRSDLKGKQRERGSQRDIATPFDFVFPPPKPKSPLASEGVNGVGNLATPPSPSNFQGATNRVLPPNGNINKDNKSLLSPVQTPDLDSDTDARVQKLQRDSFGLSPEKTSSSVFPPSALGAQLEKETEAASLSDDETPKAQAQAVSTAQSPKTPVTDSSTSSAWGDPNSPCAGKNTTFSSESIMQDTLGGIGQAPTKFDDIQSSDTYNDRMKRFWKTASNTATPKVLNSASNMPEALSARKGKSVPPSIRKDNLVDAGVNTPEYAQTTSSSGVTARETGGSAIDTFNDTPIAAAVVPSTSTTLDVPNKALNRNPSHYSLPESPLAEQGIGPSKFSFIETTGETTGTSSIAGDIYDVPDDTEESIQKSQVHSLPPSSLYLRFSMRADDKLQKRKRHYRPIYPKKLQRSEGDNDVAASTLRNPSDTPPSSLRNNQSSVPKLTAISAKKSLPRVKKNKATPATIVEPRILASTMSEQVTVEESIRHSTATETLWEQQAPNSSIESEIEGATNEHPTLSHVPLASPSGPLGMGQPSTDMEGDSREKDIAAANTLASLYGPVGSRIDAPDGFPSMEAESIEKSVPQTIWNGNFVNAGIQSAAYPSAGETIVEHIKGDQVETEPDLVTVKGDSLSSFIDTTDNQREAILNEMMAIGSNDPLNFDDPQTSTLSREYVGGEGIAVPALSSTFGSRRDAPGRSPEGAVSGECHPSLCKNPEMKDTNFKIMQGSPVSNGEHVEEHTERASEVGRDATQGSGDGNGGMRDGHDDPFLGCSSFTDDLLWETSAFEGEGESLLWAAPLEDESL
jgi:hypothetical protein